MVVKEEAVERVKSHHVDPNNLAREEPEQTASQSARKMIRIDFSPSPDHVMGEIINSARPLRNTESSLICQAKDSIRLEN